jgi:hypothetical protein
MRILQVIGWLLLLFTGMFGVYEIVQHFRHGGWALTDVGQFWFRLHPPSLHFFEGLVGPGVWNWFVRQPVLTVSAMLSALCLLMSYAVPSGPSQR